MSRASVDPKYPRQVNFQMTDQMADKVDAGVWPGRVSRAEVIRRCISKSIDSVLRDIHRTEGRS